MQHLASRSVNYHFYDRQNFVPNYQRSMNNVIETGILGLYEDRIWQLAFHLHDEGRGNVVDLIFHTFYVIF